MPESAVSVLHCTKYQLVGIIVTQIMHMTRYLNIKITMIIINFNIKIIINKVVTSRHY